MKARFQGDGLVLSLLVEIFSYNEMVDINYLEEQYPTDMPETYRAWEYPTPSEQKKIYTDINNYIICKAKLTRRWNLITSRLHRGKTSYKKWKLETTKIQIFLTRNERRKPRCLLA